MTAEAGRPGSRPPIRVVGNDEVAANVPLVHHVVRRMMGQGKLKPSLEYDDLVQVGLLALWDALRRWDPALGRRSTYCCSYIWGYLMHYQRRVTRAEGWSASLGEQIATIVSWEQQIAEDLTLLDTFAAADDTEHETEWSDAAANLRAAIAALPEPRRTIATRCWLEGAPARVVADEVGVSRQRVHQIVTALRVELREVAGLEPVAV